MLRAGLGGVTSIAALEVTLMDQALAKGWAVVTSDYEGPQSEFLAAGQEAHGVLDGIRAALAYAPDGLSATAPLAMWGYSGGAFATAWAAQIAAKYAPSLHFAGIAIGGVPSEAVPAFEQVSGGYGAGLVFGALIGLQRAFPASFTGLFTAAGNQSLADSAGSCTDALLARFAFQPVSSVTTTAHPFSDPKFVALLNAISPVGHGAPATAVPVYDYQSNDDEFIPVATDNALVAQYCQAGDTVQEIRYNYGDHITTELTGAAGAEAFLADRFAGDTPVDTCPASDTPPVVVKKPVTKAKTKAKPKAKPKTKAKGKPKGKRRV